MEPNAQGMVDVLVGHGAEAVQLRVDGQYRLAGRLASGDVVPLSFCRNEIMAGLEVLEFVEESP